MSFSCLIAVARTCSTILNANGKSWHSYAVEKFGTFHHWVWCWLWVSHIHMVWIGFPCGSAGKDAACNVGDLGLIPGLGWSPAEGKGYPLQYPSLENSTDCIVPGLTKCRTRLSDFHFTFVFPLYLLCWEFLSQIHRVLVEVFSASIEMIIWFLLFHLLMCFITLIDCVCWNIFASLGWILFDNGIWSIILIAIEFSFLMLYWELFNLYLSDTDL